jgi:hypothetical protein
VATSLVSAHVKGLTLSNEMVKALCYKPEGRRFVRPDEVNFFFNLPNTSSCTRPWRLLSL